MVHALEERLNWQQACEILGCKKDTFYRLIREGKLPVYGAGKRFRWVKRQDCEHLLGERAFPEGEREGLNRT